MSEKVRYYLEQSVEEIQDLKKRGIFTEHELQTIIKRRTDYEHRLLARTVKPAEFISYANYENSVDKLRAIRAKKLRKSGALSGSGRSDWAGPRRINFIWERAVRRFPADLDLWKRSVDYAKSQNMVNIVNKALTSMLRLHPTKPEVWVYVAKYQAEDNASIVEARTVLQRGLRFNNTSAYLWLEYMRLELIYIAKILARRKLLGIERATKDETKELEKKNELELTSQDLQDAERDIKNLPDVNIEILGDVSSNPALRGDIALAVFDAAIANDIGDTIEFCRSTLALFDEFTGLDRLHLSSHVIGYALDHNGPKIWTVTLPIRYVDVHDPKFPDQLRLVMAQYSKLKSPELAQDVREYFSGILEGELDASLKKAIELWLQRI